MLSIPWIWRNREQQKTKQQKQNKTKQQKSVCETSTVVLQIVELSLSPHLTVTFFLNFLMFIFEREREHERGRGRERESDTESEAVSRLWAVSTEPEAWHEPQDHDLNQSQMPNQLSHPGAPRLLLFFIICICIYIYIFIYLFIYFIYFIFFFWRERDTQHVSREGAERENPKQALHCQLRAWCRAQTHELWDHDLSLNQGSDA